MKNRRGVQGSSAPACLGLDDRVKVAHVSWNMQRGHLPSAVLHLVNPTCKALHYQAGVIDDLARGSDVEASLDLRCVAGQSQNGRAFFFAELRVPQQSSKELTERMLVGVHL